VPTDFPCVSEGLLVQTAETASEAPGSASASLRTRKADAQRPKSLEFSASQETRVST